MGSVFPKIVRKMLGTTSVCVSPNSAHASGLLFVLWVIRSDVQDFLSPVQAGYFGRGKALGVLLWPRKNLGRVLSAAERSWAGDLGCGKLGRALFWLQKETCACAHS